MVMPFVLLYVPGLCVREEEHGRGSGTFDPVRTGRTRWKLLKLNEVTLRCGINNQKRERLWDVAFEN